MEKLGENIWIFDGTTVSFLGFPFKTRMTVIRLDNGELWIHSPIKMSPTLSEHIAQLGEVKYLIAPNHLHHLFISDWLSAYPQALLFGTDEVIKKRSDLTFEGSLNSSTEALWAGEIEQELFSGSPVMEECVFFHVTSRTLIVTDLVENFSGEDFNYWQRLVARGVGILAPNGKTPLDWRLSFMFGKEDARLHLERLLAWKPQTLVMSHGEIVKQNVGQFLNRSFDWLI
ncbi:hypothetical protein NM09_18875 [Vibrio caribbeanicus]|uniref:Uncharacterized protein n=1 Tax=Vibrio caribbeanicus TaxID=701175 RepID=A0ACC4NS35_9VIBR|nr:DUF4336 domain-containing protein [Vibrio caribbeanicus]KHD23304.1 hypothetical protein NM09_18875 [Vibrio caribbeanicus]